MRLGLTLFVVALNSLAADAGAEEPCRGVLWPTEGAAEADVESARARLGESCEVVPLPAPAAPGPSPEAERLRAAVSAALSEATDRYYEADFAEAARLLGVAVEARAVELAEAGALDLLGSVLVWQGASLVKSGARERAMAAFTLAMAVGIEEIDRALYPPEVTRVFDRARRARESASPVSITIDSSPPGAAVEVDGDASPEVTPARVDVAAGLHVLVARRAGYRSVARLVEVGATTPSVTLTLEPAEPDLAVRQVSRLRQAGRLDSADRAHVGLVASATGADLVAIVEGGGHVLLVDGAGVPVSWPAPPAVTAAEADAGVASSDPLAPSAIAPAPVWRRWWFWVALVGGAAVVGTSVGLGVHYGTMERDTFTLVPGERPGGP